jgi:hypothetical protein
MRPQRALGIFIRWVPIISILLPIGWMYGNVFPIEIGTLDLIIDISVDPTNTIYLELPR